MTNNDDKGHGVDWAYVNRLREEMQRELEGFHKRINEIEELRYLEEKIPLASQEKQSGVEVRIGLTAELIENVKSSLTTNPPKVTIKPLRDSDTARKNSSKREAFWNQFLLWINTLVPTLIELADGQGGLGIGILKASGFSWPKEERKRRKNGKEFTETPLEHTNRIRGLKRKWGPPFRAITIHPLTFYFRLGAGGRIAEAVEHSWKPRRQVLKDYNQPIDAFNVTVEQLAATTGQPTETIRSLPYGTSTETLALVTEYWSPDLYQVYINGNLVHEEEGDPGVSYFIAVGRSTSSKDPDKFGFSVAEILRHNEPIINATLTRMAEAANLLVRKRLVMQTPEGFVPEQIADDSGALVDKVYELKGDVIEVLPEQVEVKDPYEGVENIYAAMPFIELMLRITGQHGVAPIFKGMPPGAQGSGYRDVSLYMMAKSQFSYLMQSYSNCLSQFISWLEDQVVKDEREIFVGDVSLRPSDIKDWPAIVTVNIDPLLPQNIIPMGQFYDRMWAEGHIPSRLVVEKGMKEEQPQELRRERDLEDLKRMMQPILFRHVLQVVGMLPTIPMGGGEGGEVEAVTGERGPGGAQQMLEAPGKGESAQAQGGLARGGQPRQPPEEPGTISPSEPAI